MNYSKLFKFIALIIVILFFSYLNSTRDNSVSEGFTSNFREYYNKRKRELRHNIEDFKTKTSNTVNKIYKKYNPI